MPPKPQVFTTPDGKEFASKKEWREYMVLTFYSFKNRSNEQEPLIKQPGSINGQMFTIENVENCTIAVCDACETIHVDNVKKSKVFLAATASSTFIRDCEDCIFFTCCQQLRIRDCVRCDFYVYSSSEVHIETSSAVRFGPFRGGYPQHKEHLQSAKIDNRSNLWYDIFDHNDPLKTHANWSLVAESGYAEPWFPLGACDVSVEVNAVGSVDRSKESDANMSSFGVDQLRIDAAKTSSPQKLPAVPITGEGTVELPATSSVDASSNLANWSCPTCNHSEVAEKNECTHCGTLRGDASTSAPVQIAIVSESQVEPPVPPTAAAANIVGAFGGALPAGEEEQQLLDQIKGAVERHLNKTFSDFHAVLFTTQVVAGTNYLFKVNVGGDQFLHLKLHKPLPFRNEPPHLMALQDGKGASDILEYFE